MVETPPPPLSRMKRRQEYEPVGKCIYCGSRDESFNKLTLEHIIPESLGGTLKLPKASCQNCMKITSAFEGDNAGKLFRPIRRQYNLPSKHRGKERKAQRQNETFVVKINGVKRKITASQYPGLIVSFAFPMPTILLGQVATLTSFSGGISVGTLPEFGDRLNALRAKYGSHVEFPTRGSAEAVGRLLAKIAHSYAIAEIGCDKFTPYLLGIIRGQDPYIMHHLIGSAPQHAPASDDLHEIDIIPSSDFEAAERLITVKVRLFSNHQGIATHYVVAGERL